MASLSQDRNGLWRLLVMLPDRSRKALRLGRIAKGDAQKFKFRVERIVTCIKLGESLDAETANWCAKLPDEEFEKLVAIGLLAARAKAADFELAGFIEQYIETRKAECSAGTLGLFQQAKRSMVEFFGPDRQLAQITRADADLFAAHLRQHLGENTAARRIGYAQMFFRRAVRGKLLLENPFDDQKVTFRPNREREFFVTREAFQKILDACPDAEWRAIWTFARIGGVRIPSELQGMTWADINVDAGTVLIRSPKTKHCDKATRVLPLFPELRKAMAELYHLAPDGSTYVFPSARARRNLQNQMRSIIRAAGLPIWEKLYVNCRASRLTELCEQFPLATVCRWMGNTSRIAAQHYMRDQQADFERATTAAAADLRTECAHLGPVSGRNTEASPDASEVPPAKNPGKLPGTALCLPGQMQAVSQVPILQKRENCGNTPLSCPDLNALADGRYRLKHDESYHAEHGERGRTADSWLLSIPCLHGHVFPFGSGTLAASTDRRGAIAKTLAALPGCHLHQDGDDGLTVVFPEQRMRIQHIQVEPGGVNFE